MAIYLLDTNHLSPLVTVDHNLRHRLIAAAQSGHTFAIAAPVLAEFLYGIQTLPRAKANLQEWQRYHDRFDFYDIQRLDAESAASIQVILRKQGWQLKTVDALIAAVALRYGFTLLTTDRDFTAIPGLALENWLVES